MEVRKTAKNSHDFEISHNFEISEREIATFMGKKYFKYFENISNFLRANNKIFQVLRLGISGAEKANGFADNKRGKQPTQLIFNNLERALKLQRNFEVFNGVFSNGGFSEF